MQARARGVMRRMATGAALVSVRGADGRPKGAVASAFNSVSLEPPMLLWTLPAADFEALALAENSACGLCILSERQERFAQGGAKAAEAVWDSGDVFGVPLLSGASAAFEVIVTRTERHGENVLCFGEPARVSYADGAAGLLRYSGETGTAVPMA